MPRRGDRQALLMAMVLVSATGVAVVDRAAAPLQDASGRALAPLQTALGSSAARVDAVAGRVRDMQALQSRLSELEVRNDSLEVENLKVRDLIHENDRLRDLLSFTRHRVDLDLRGASVVGRPLGVEPGNLIHTLRVDIGRRHGVDVAMPVANERGLIGRVMRAGTTWSDVLLVTDPSSAVQGRVERSRATGVVFGTTRGDLVMRFVPQDRGGDPSVRPGDIVFTSGLSREFPAMIAIGQVVDVRQSDVQTHQEAVIRPTVDFTALELVLVVTDFEPLSDPDGIPRPSLEGDQ